MYELMLARSGFYLLFMGFKCKTINRKFEVEDGQILEKIRGQQMCKNTTMEEFRWTGSRKLLFENYYYCQILQTSFLILVFLIFTRNVHGQKDVQTKGGTGTLERKFLRSLNAVCKKSAIDHGIAFYGAEYVTLSVSVWRFYSLGTIAERCITRP